MIKINQKYTCVLHIISVTLKIRLNTSLNTFGHLKMIDIKIN